MGNGFSCEEGAVAKRSEVVETEMHSAWRDRGYRVSGSGQLLWVEAARNKSGPPSLPYGFIRFYTILAEMQQPCKVPAWQWMASGTQTSGRLRSSNLGTLCPLADSGQGA